MERNPHVIARLEAIQDIVVAHYKAGAKLPAAHKGFERETFLQEFLCRVFPPVYRFGTGTITDSVGRLSGQCDIVAEFPLLPTFPVPSGEGRLYMAEGVALVIEVKSNLSSQWDEVRSTTRKLKQLRRDVRQWISTDQKVSPVLPVFAVGYTGYSTTDGLKKRLEETPEPERPGAAFCLDSGCFVCGNARADKQVGVFCFLDAMYEQFNRLALASPDILRYIGIDVAAIEQKQREEGK